MANVVEVGEADFERKVVEASRDLPVVVDFWAGWCRPCLVLGPILEKLADEHGGRFLLAKVDVDANPSLAAEHGVQGIPAVKAFRGGEVVDEFVGAQPEDVVRLWLRGIVPSEAEGVAEEARAAEEAGDAAAAETAYRRALETDPDHEGSAVGLARILLARGEADEARRLAGRFPASEEGRRVAAEADLRAAAGNGDLETLRARAESDPRDDEAALALAAAEANAGAYGDALERCLRLIAARGAALEGARDLMVKVFEMLGEGHPLVRDYRPRLASALY